MDACVGVGNECAHTQKKDYGNYMRGSIHNLFIVILLPPSLSSNQSLSS